MTGTAALQDAALQDAALQDTALHEATTLVAGVRRPAGPPARRLRLVVRSLQADLRAAPFRMWVNSIGGHPSLPRVARWLVYRIGGLDVRTANVYPGCTFVARNTTIGADTFVNRGCLFEGAGPLRIGADCQIAMEAMFLTSTHPWEEDGSFARRPRNLATTVGDRCWIGARALVLPGVTVGDGCVIAAGAVVTSDCEPHSLYAGVPARRIRPLTTPGVVR